jgi:NAD(P)-dependent dehydrogenase (short-subunit alcohol dehydrogenase family)
VGAGPAAFEASLRRNLTHYYAIVHYAAEQLQTNQGAIVNVSSKVSITGQGGTSGYAAAKGAVNALTREWAAEFAEVGVRVNTVVPAEVWTPMYEQWLHSAADPAAERRRIEASIPLGRRFTRIDEMAKVVVFLASSASSHVTGQIIHVDGGYVHLDRRLTL